MIQFARHGLGVAVVNDICPVARGLVGVRLEGVPDVEYQVLTRLGGERESRDTLVRRILESVG